MDCIYYKNLKVDIYIPNKIDFTTIVYFHGGGLVEGSRSQDNLINISNRLKDKGFCVFNFDYSLYPNAKFPDFIIDAAHAVKFAFEKIKELKGNGDVYVSGSSAGAYLASMLMANPNYLKNVGINPLFIKGWFIESGQMTDHFHILELEENIDPGVERITEKSPMFFVNENFVASPIFLLLYDDDIPNRLKQNLEFVKKVEATKNTKIFYSIIKGMHCEGSSHPYDSGEYPFISELLSFIEKN